MDRTAEFLGAAKLPANHDALLRLRSRPVPKAAASLSDPILFDAYQIATTIADAYAHHMSIRRPYLGLVASAAEAYSPSERDAIDVRGAAIVAQCRAAIQKLELAVRACVQSLRYKGSTLASLRRAAGAKTGGGLLAAVFGSDYYHRGLDTHREHYHSILRTLGRQLQFLSAALQQVQETRMRQDLDDILCVRPGSARGPGLGPPRLQAYSATGSGGGGEAETGSTLASKSKSASSMGVGGRLQVQLEVENADLLAQWQADLSEVRQAEASLLAIAQFQADMAQHLAHHQTALESIWAEAGTQTTQVRQGNEQLTIALDRGKGRRLWFLVLVLLVSILLLLIDRLN